MLIAIKLLVSDNNIITFIRYTDKFVYFLADIRFLVTGFALTLLYRYQNLSSSRKKIYFAEFLVNVLRLQIWFSLEQVIRVVNKIGLFYLNSEKESW